MSKPIVLSKVKWDELKERLCADYPRSVMLLRYKMKEVLGFTPRTHIQEWIDQEVDISDVKYTARFAVETIHLDFYNDSVQTMFRLKYSEYLQGSRHGNNS